MAAGDFSYLIGEGGVEMELDDSTHCVEGFPQGTVLGRGQDLLVWVVHGVEAETEQTAFLHPVARLGSVVGVLRVEHAVADKAVGKTGLRIGDIAVVPGGPASLHQDAAVNAVLVHVLD